MWDPAISSPELIMSMGGKTVRRPGNVGIAPAALVSVGPDHSFVQMSIVELPESVNSISFGVAKFRPVAVGGDGFGAGSNVWGISMRARGAMCTKIWSSGVQSTQPGCVLAVGDKVLIEVDRNRDRGAIAVNGQEIHAFSSPSNESLVMGVSLSDDAVVTLDELGYRRKLSVREETLCEMWRRGKFTDGVVECEGQVYPIHRAFLCSMSPVFEAAFDGQFTESQTAKLAVGDATPEATHAMLTHLYTGQLPDEADLLEIMGLAHRFQLYDLLKTCAERLEKLLAPDTVGTTLRSLRRFRDDERIAQVYHRVKEVVHSRRDLYDALIDSL